MRIRKNAKLCSSSLQFTSSNVPVEEHLLQPHMCQLNQSPWDVIPLSPRSLCCPYSFPLHPKFEREDSLAGTWSNWDSPAPALSSFPVEVHDEEKPAAFAGDGDSYGLCNGYHDDSNMKLKKMMKKKKKKKQGGSGSLSTKPSSQKSNGKAWHGKKEPLIDGDVIGGYQMLKCSSSVTDNNYNNAAASKGSSRRARGAKKGSSSNPYEFYYYSGFGPSWGKRRGNTGGKEDGQYGNFIIPGNNTVTAISPTTPNTTPDSELPSPIQLPGEANLDLMSDDDYTLDIVDEEEENERGEDRELGGSQRRMRKLVKARSLKSLM